VKDRENGLLVSFHEKKKTKFGFNMLLLMFLSFHITRKTKLGRERLFFIQFSSFKPIRGSLSL
jgi:hypothetical protein